MSKSTEQEIVPTPGLSAQEPRQPWVMPAVTPLPPLTALTLQTG